MQYLLDIGVPHLQPRATSHSGGSPMSPFAIRSLRAFFTFAALACLILLQPKPSLGQSSPSVSTDPKTSRTSDPVDQDLFVSYWTTQTRWPSELHLSNNLVAPDPPLSPPPPPPHQHPPPPPSHP